MLLIYLEGRVLCGVFMACLCELKLRAYRCSGKHTTITHGIQTATFRPMAVDCFYWKSFRYS